MENLATDLSCQEDVTYVISKTCSSPNIDCCADDCTCCTSWIANTDKKSYACRCADRIGGSSCSS